MFCVGLFQVAQYIHFATPVLEAFLDKYQEEEDKEAERIKHRYHFTSKSAEFKTGEKNLKFHFAKLSKTNSTT